MADVVGQTITFHRSGKTAPNRTLKSAMTERLCSWDDSDANACGKPTDDYLRLYQTWGQGRIGVLVLGNIPCDRRYPEARRNAVIDPLSTWDAVAAFKPIIEAARATGSLVIGQVTHAGRQTSDNITKEPVSSSDVQSGPLGGMTFAKPRPMTIDEIQDTVKRWAHAAKVLYDAGADGVQLHAAHGYLLSQFLSPKVNTRTDEYGGSSLDNRSRIVFEILEAIKKAVADEKFILSIKINSADFSDGGFDEEDSREMAKRLEAAGVDLIELSGGTYESMAFQHKKDSTKRREAFFIEFAERIRPHLKTAKLAVTGGFRSTEGMASAIKENACDICGLARPLTAEPLLVDHLLTGAKREALANHVDQSVQTASSYLQVGQIGTGLPIADLSDEARAKRVEETIKKDTAAAFLFRPQLEVV